MVEQRVHPDCINASNPFHECVAYCFRKIAEAKARKDKSESDKPREIKMEEQRVHPDCINASNQFHECVAYCFRKIAEAKAGKDKLKTDKPREIKMEEQRVHPNCINASNPFHECVEYCFRKIAEAKARKDKSETGFGCCSCDSELKDKPRDIKMEEQRVHPDCINASNPFHECVEYCFRKIAEAKARKDKSETDKPRDIKMEEQRVHPDCINASNPFHECVEYCFRKIAEAKARKDKLKTEPKENSDVDGDHPVDENIEADITNLTGRQEKLFGLRLRMNESRKANQTAMVVEKKRMEAFPECKQKWVAGRKKKNV
ncbi:hypothetical protein GQ457_18G018440 [Hibiscus cannabinus]